jgi:maltose alpha-D-glucosyltransferase / alpha-amylase
VSYLKYMNSNNWWSSSIIYELYVDKFAGNFKNLTSQLDYFVNLGVNTLWILPHYPSPMVDGGYDISDYYSVRSDLGTLSDFNDFVSASHSKNLKVIIDMVLNHTSIDHPWFTEHPDWYLWSETPDKYSGAFIHFSELKSGSNWIINPAGKNFYYASFYPSQPDLNWDNPHVVTAMTGVIDFWLDRGVDGLRLDAVSRLVKRDGTSCFGLPENHQILKNLRSHIDSKYQNRVLMAETGGWPVEAAQFFGSGDECQLVINFPLAARLLSSISNQNLPSTLDLLPSTPENCKWSGFLTNHDTVDVFFLADPDFRLQFIKDVNPDGLFTQINSASFASRLSNICHGDQDKILWAFSQLLSQPIVPIIYYGNEIGMPSAKLDHIPADARDYVRAPFDWSEAQKQLSNPDSILNSIRKLITNRTSA